MCGQHPLGSGRTSAEHSRAHSGQGPARNPSGGLQHEAFFYAGEKDFLAGMVPFLLEGIDAEEPALVMVGGPRLQRLREAVGEHDGLVSYADMEVVGRNPARIIPAWKQFVDRFAGHRGRLRGIGEPIWAGRSPSELEECQLHEALLNLAFADAADFWLMCPYDSHALDRSVLNAAHQTHPVVSQSGERSKSILYSHAAVSDGFERPLPEPATDEVSQLAFAGVDGVGVVRDLVRAHALGLGVASPTVSDFTLAVSEIATNSVRHGGGGGFARVWAQDGMLICDVTDRGVVEHPLVGRERPRWDQVGGRGLWMANQLCRLVQIRSGQSGTTVRLHVDA